MMPLPEMTLATANVCLKMCAQIVQNPETIVTQEQNPGNLPKIVKFTHNACIMDITETCSK